MSTKRRALQRLRANRARWSHYVATVAEQLHLSPVQAAAWIEVMHEEGRVDLVDIVVEGVLVEAGHLFHPED